MGKANISARKVKSAQNVSRKRKVSERGRRMGGAFLEGEECPKSPQLAKRLDLQEAEAFDYLLDLKRGRREAVVYTGAECRSTLVGRKPYKKEKKNHDELVQPCIRGGTRVE